MTRRSRFVHNLELPSCFRRLRISLFFSSTRSSHPCLRVAVRCKSDWICAQLPFSVPRFHLRRSLYSSLPTFFHCCRISLFSRRLALYLNSFKWQLATSPAGSALSYHFPFYNSIFADLSTLRFRHSFIALASRSFLVDFLFHYGILSSSYPSVYQRPLVFVCFRKPPRTP